MALELSAADELYFAIKTRKGWDYALDQAQDFNGPYGFKIGSIISSILLAADDSTKALAVTGELDDNGHGSISVVYPSLLVSVVVDKLTAATGTIQTTVHGLSELSGLEVRTGHNYYDGTKTSARHKGIQFDVFLAGRRLRFVSEYAGGPLVDPDAVYAAFKVVRDSIASR